MSMPQEEKTTAFAFGRLLYLKCGIEDLLREILKKYNENTAFVQF